MNVKFYYQCNASLATDGPDIHVDGFVSGDTPEECLKLAHSHTKDQLSEAIRKYKPSHIEFISSIQSRMVIFNQICQCEGKASQ